MLCLLSSDDPARIGVKQRVGLTSFADDALLTTLIKWASDQFEARCNRKFGRLANDTYEFQAWLCEIVLPRYPVESIAGIYVRSNAVSDWVLQDTVDYEMEPKSGIVSIHSGPVGSKIQRAKIVFTGGYVLPGDPVGDGQIPLPNEIESACLDQVACWYANRNSFRFDDLAKPGAAQRREPKPSLLPSVEATLLDYRRIQI